ncbi:hypothetical protein L218DRAFT_1080120 [Marasmius fiardii PR-910]|nr:hypothetical protein L218DRAFT_1080120 [Marasmius fiardii PR-910]
MDDNAQKSMIDATVRREEAEAEALGPLEHITDGIQESEHVATPRSRISFIFTLPNELFAAVFQLCVHADTGGHAVSKDAVQWVLSHTCRRWRQVLLSTPSLWSMVRINGHRFPRAPVQIVRTWLDRSQNLPLSCSLLAKGHPSRAADAMDLTSNPTKDQLEEILGLVLAQFHRWRHVNFILNDGRWDLQRRLAAIHGLTLPLLQSFYVSAPNTIYGTAWTTFSLNAPALSSAFIGILVSNVDVHVASLPWSQLVELKIYLYAPERFLDIVNSLKVLKYCSIIMPSSSITFDVQLMVFPLSLRRLEISGGFNDVVNLLNHLSAPGLSDLHIRHRSESTLLLSLINTGRTLSASAFAFLTRSHCQLRKLNVPSTFFDYVDLRTDSLSTLEELHIRFQTKAGIDQIMGNLIRFDLLPNVKEMHLTLKELFLRGDAIHDFLVEVLDMIEIRRWESQGPSRSYVALDRVGFDTLSDYRNRSKKQIPISDEIVVRLEKLQQDGLTVLGNVFDGYLCPLYPGALSHWDIEKNELMKARFGFGYDDGFQGGF